MLPNLAVDDLVNGRSAAVVHGNQLQLSEANRMQLTDRGYLSISQLGLQVLLALGLTILGLAIGHVVSVCAQEEVIRTHAAPVIAVMQYLEAIGDGAIRQNPRHAMSTRPMDRTALPIAIVEKPTSPAPATFSLGHFRPE